MIKPVVYLDYDKISDLMMYLGLNTSLNFNVNLSKKGQNGERYHFHKEYIYPSKYSDYGKVISIKRSFSYYLTIDKREPRQSIMIRIQDLIILRSILSGVSSWFTDDTFGIKNNVLVIHKAKKPMMVNNLAENKYLQFNPIVMTSENTSIQQQGIRITLGDPNIYTDIGIDTFFGFKELIDRMDMFGYAQNMINYLGHPEFGTNSYEFDNNNYIPDEPQQEKSITKAKSRQIPSLEKKKSFFDR